MSKEIRTVIWCDGPIHQDEQIEAAVSRRFVVDNMKVREIDLCETCDKEYAQPLIELLKENGQPVKDGQPATLFDPVPARKARSATRRPSEIRCPVEDCDWDGTISAAGQHVPRYHGGETLAALEGRYGRRLLDGSRKVLEFRCPDCDQAFDNNRSLAGHKVHGH